jgi:hypothetical protein
MTQMLKIHQTRYSAAFEFLSQDLPALKTSDPSIWDALLKNAHLADAEAVQVLTMDGSAPLIFASDLGASVYGQFDPQIPGRVEIAIEVLSRFTSDASDTVARRFLRAKVLHEICHWACFRRQVPDNDTAGEAFEMAAFAGELMPWWTEAVARAGNVFSDPVARADALISLLGKRGFAQGRGEDPARAVFGGADVGEAMPRGFRNNNPGNIRVSSSMWRGLADPIDKTEFQQRESSFCVFREPEWGLRALAMLLRRYKTEHGLDTPRKIIARWAPAGDNNDVTSYATQLALALGMGPDDFVDATVDESLVVMMRAIARHENGARPPYAGMQYLTALDLLRR